MKIAFDVDDTLLVPSVAGGFPVDTPNYETIAVYRWFQAQGHHMIYLERERSGLGQDMGRTIMEIEKNLPRNPSTNDVKR